MSNWWDRIQMAIGRSKDVVITPSDPGDRSKKATLTSPEWVSAPMMGSPRHINFLELEEYEEDVTVQAAANYIIDSIATSDWDIVPDEDMVDEGEEVDNSDAVKFFQSSTWDESFSTVLRGVIADVLLYDSGVVVLTFPEFCYDEDKTLIKKGIAPLSLRARDGRSFIKQVDMYGDIIKYWQYSFLHTATKPVEFAQEEIIYMQERPSTRSPYGTSKLEVVKNVADLMMAVQVGHRSEQENALQIGGVISHSDVTDPEKLRRLSAMYNSTLKGEHNKKRWLTTGGNVDVKPINASVADDSWIPGSEFYQQQILAIFKVPKTVLGITSSDTNRATAFAQSANFKRFGVATMMTLIDGIFTREIVKKYFNKKLVFRFVREVDLSDESLRADIDSKNVATGVRTVNELRTRDGLEEIEEPEPEEEMSMLPDWSEYEPEYHEGEMSEEMAEKSIGRVWIKPSANRKGHWRTTKPGETKGTPHQMIEDSLLFGVERYVEKGEKKLQEIDVGLGIDPKIGEARRKSAKSERVALTQISGRGAAADHFEYMAGVKGLLEKGDIEKKKGGFKLTKLGKERMKETDAAVVQHFKDVPTKSEGAKAQQKALSDQYMRMVEYNARRFKPASIEKSICDETIEEGIEKSGGIDRIWIKPISNRKGHWRKVKPGKGDDKGDNIKAKIGMFQDLGDALKKELKSLIDKLSVGGITPEGKVKVEAIKTKMDKAYANRDAAIKAWEKHTGKKWAEKKPAAKKPGEKKPSGEKKDSKPSKPQSGEAKAKAKESQRLKGEINKFQSEGDAAKSQMNTAIDKYTTPSGEITAANQKKIDALESKMNDAYNDRDAAKKELKDVESGDSGDMYGALLKDVKSKEAIVDASYESMMTNTKQMKSWLKGKDKNNLSQSDQKVYDGMKKNADMLFTATMKAGVEYRESIKKYDELTGHSYLQEKGKRDAIEREKSKFAEFRAKTVSRSKMISEEKYRITGYTLHDTKIKSVENTFNGLISDGRSMEEAVGIIINGDTDVHDKNLEIYQDGRKLEGSAKLQYAEILENFNTIISSKYKDKLDITVNNVNIDRAYAETDSMDINLAPKGVGESAMVSETFFHEAGHLIEKLGGNYSVAAKFVENRTKNVKTEKLKDMFPGSGYRDDEITKPDNFVNPYVGKDYGYGNTEVISMGLERFSSSRLKSEFYDQDVEHFMLTLAVMAGEFI